MIVVGICTPQTTGCCGKSIGYTGLRLCNCQFDCWGAFSGVHKLTSVPTSVESLECGHWGTQAHIYAHVS